MSKPALVSTTGELRQILQLQKENLPENVNDAEMKTQGFVTLRHDLSTLEQMHQLAPSVIIKDNEIVVAYALTMLKECRQLIPGLEPMFALLDHLNWENKALNNYRFYVMGQICVAKPYRGKGFFEQLYEHHKKIYQPLFDLFVTEISTWNSRSLRAHEKIGFKPIHTHRDDLDEWSVVAWNWK